MAWPGGILGDLSVLEAIVSVGAGVFGAVGITRLPRIWRNEVGWDSDRPPVHWPFGVPSWRGLVRATPFSFPIFLVAAPVYALDKADASGPLADAIVAVGAAVGAVLLFIVVPAVFLFARPKRLIAPHLRHQCGAVAEWRGQRPRRTPPPDVQPGFPLRR